MESDFQKRVNVRMPIYDVFVSYRRSDGAELAAVVAAYLRGKGLSVFFDTEEIKSGEDFTRRIEGALRQAPNYLLVATPDVFRFRTGEKDWVLEEMKIACENYAHDLDKNRMFTLVVPQYVYTAVNPNDPSEGKRRVQVVLPKAESWPPEVFDLSKSNWITLRSDLPNNGELREILTSVTRVTHHNMWNAGYRWLLENRQPGRRFASLDISKTIFPHALPVDGQPEEPEEEFPAMVQEQQTPSAKPEGEKLPLFDALAKTENHIYMVGEGGIGKTTGLIHIMEKAYKNKTYSETAQIPLFVELSKAPDTTGRLYANGKSTFIYRAIYRQIRQDRTVKQVTGAELGAMDEVFTADPHTVVSPVKALLADQVRPPQYLLLLDGLNEVSRTELAIRPTDEDGKATSEPLIRRTVYEMIVEEINQIMENCPNVQLVLTGRADDGAVQGKNITRWLLSGIDDQAIRAYLRGRVSPGEIGAVMGNRALLDTLRIPLFLTMYIRLKEKADITARGEILHTFFSEKGKLLGDYDLPYSMRNRLGQVEEELNHSASGKPDLRLSAAMQFFMIDFLLAALGRYMEKKNLFSVTFHQVEEVICPVLESADPTAVCGRFGQQAFPRYKKKGSLSSTSTVARQLKGILGTGSEAARQFCLLASSVLGVLVDDGKYNYSFIHQHVRDYFAALHVMNALWIGVVCGWSDPEAAYAFLNSELAGEPLGFTVRQMLGEAVGEHHNKPRQDEEGNWHYNVPAKTTPHSRNLIPMAMDVYRGHFDEKNSYALWNLIQVLKEVRGELCGEDFSRLDLTLIRLNRHRPGMRGCAANFAGAKLQRELFMPSGHTDVVNAVAFSPDGTKIVTASWDRTAKVWDAATLLELGTLEGHTDQVKTAVYSPDGKRILTTSRDGTAKLWDAETLREAAALKGHRKPVQSAVYSPDGKRILTASYDGTAKLWDAETARVLGTLEGHTGMLESAAFSPDGKRILTASRDGTAKLWDAETLREAAALKGHRKPVQSAVYSPDGKRILTASWDRTAKVWDAETLRKLGTLEGHKDRVESAVFSPDGKRILTASWDGTAKLWDAATLLELGTLEGHTDNVETVVYSPDGKRILTASWDRTARIWDAATFQELGTLEGNRSKVRSAAYSPDGKRIVAVSADDTAKIWDAETYRKLGTLEGNRSSVYSAAYSPDGKRIVTAPWNETPKLWDAESFRPLRTSEVDARFEKSAVYSPDGKQILTVSEDGTAKLWDAETLRKLGTLEGHKDRVESAVFSADGKRILTASWDGTAKIWDAATLRELGTLEGHTGPLRYAVYSPDGKRILTVLRDETVKLWDAATFRELRTWKGYLAGVRSAVYSPDGRRIVTTSWKKTAKIRSAKTFWVLGTLKGHKKNVNTAVYRSDGCRILTASADGTVRIWNAKTCRCIRTIWNVADLEVLGCNLHDLHPDSVLSDVDRQMLRDHGAEVATRPAAAKGRLRAFLSVFRKLGTGNGH